MQTTYELITKKELDSGQLAYRFSVPVDGEYEILMADSKVVPFYQKNLSQLDLWIDNTVQTRNSQIKDDFISYGIIPLKAGQHEFSFNIQNSVNLIKNKQEEIKINSDREAFLLEFAQKTDGYVGADIESICREAAIFALRENMSAKAITKKHFEKALEKVPASVTKEIEKAYEKLREHLSSARGKQMLEEKPVYMG